MKPTIGFYRKEPLDPASRSPRFALPAVREDEKGNRATHYATKEPIPPSPVPLTP